MADWHLEAYERWLTTEFSVSTVDVYARAAKQFANSMKRTPKKAGLFDAKDVETFLLRLQEKTSIETEHVYSRALMRYTEFLVTKMSEPIDIKAIQDRISQLRRQKGHELPVLSLDVLGKIHNFAIGWSPQPNPDNMRNTCRDLRDKAFTLVLAETGLRVGGVMNLREGGFSSTDKTLAPTVHETIHLKSHTALAIRRYLNTRGQYYPSTPNSILFARHDKRASNNLLAISRWTAANIIEHVATQALSPQERQDLLDEGISLSPHSFRHYFVAMTLNTTGSIEETQVAAMHGTAATTRKYLELVKKETKNEQSD